MLDRDLLVDIYTKLGKVETGIDNIREDHRDLRFMISKNTDDIVSIREDLASAKGAARLTKWAVGVGLAVAGFLVGGGTAN